MKLYLHRIGADPEMLVGRASNDFEFQTHNAGRVLFGGAGAPNTSFIGLDGHPFTAELRPPPARNVNLLLYHVAQGLLTTQRFLDQRHAGTTLLARPQINEETLGGHIHLSFYPAAPPIQREMLAKYGWVIRGGDARPAENGGRELPRAAYAKLTDERAELFDLATFARKLNWLVLPLEYWAQPWFSRRQRNGRYGVPTDMRTTLHPVDRWPAMGGISEKYPYMHVEYRAPSTWLAHPRLAYLYLALAKVVVLNHDAVPSDKIDWKGGAETPANDKFHDMLLENWRSRRWRQSADTRAIDQNLEWLAENRAALWRPDVGINIAAWRELFDKEVTLETPEPEDDPLDTPPAGEGPREAVFADVDFDDDDYEEVYDEDD